MVDPPSLWHTHAARTECSTLLPHAEDSWWPPGGPTRTLPKGYDPGSDSNWVDLNPGLQHPTPLLLSNRSLWAPASWALEDKDERMWADSEVRSFSS